MSTLIKKSFIFHNRHEANVLFTLFKKCCKMPKVDYTSESSTPRRKIDDLYGTLQSTWDITQVLSVGSFISLYKKKRKPTVQWLCPFWTGRNRCGLTMPGENEASQRRPGGRWSSVSRFPLQTWQPIESGWSFKKHVIRDATQMFQSTNLNVYVYLSPEYRKQS